MQSKKFVAMLIGVGCGLLVYGSALYVIAVKNATDSADIVHLANIVIVYLGATVSFLIGGQSVVDWKNYTALERVTRSEMQTRNTNVNVRVTRADAAIIRKFQDENANDPSYRPITAEDLDGQEVWRNE
jgi:hypothetical protein